MSSIIVTSKTHEIKVMVLFTKIREIEQIETLIDTGASGNFIKRAVIEELEQKESVHVQTCQLTLQLAKNETIITTGIVWLLITIGNKQMQVQMYVLESRHTH